MGDSIKVIKVLLPLLFCFLISCDPHSSQGFICNKTNKPIEITIKLNRERIKREAGDNQAVLILKRIKKMDENLTELEIDTNKLIGTYSIATDKCARMGGGLSPTPSFIFNYLEIHTPHDTLKYENDREIEAAFKYVDGSVFALDVE